MPEGQVQDFADKVQANMQAMFGTNPDNRDYTSVVSDRHYARLESLVADAAAKGARIMQAAKPDDPAWKSKRKFPPTIVVGATADMTIMQEEIFGPLLPVIGYKDAAEPVAYINKHDRPLALYWFGKDDAARDEVLARTVSGGVTVNDCLFHFAQINQPMGGVGASGTGAYHGEWGFDTLSKLKPVFYRSAVQPAGRSLSALRRQDRADGKAAAVLVVASPALPSSGGCEAQSRCLESVRDDDGLPSGRRVTLTSARTHHPRSRRCRSCSARRSRPAA